MSLEVPSAFTVAFDNAVLHLAQQQGSRLRNSVRRKPGVRGQSVWFEQVGKGAAKKVVSRHRPTPQVSRPHQSSRALIEDFEEGDLVDDLDRTKMEFDAAAVYVQSIAFSLGRSIDDIIITAALGSATRAVAGIDKEDSTNWSTVALPAGQKIAAGGTGLTRAKLVQGRALFYAADVPMDEELFLLVNNKAIEDILNLRTPLRFLFRRIHSERLNTNASSERELPAYSRMGIGLGGARDPRTRMAERPDLAFAIQAYGNMAFGAVRVDDTRVVQIDIDET